MQRKLKQYYNQTETLSSVERMEDSMNEINTKHLVDILKQPITEEATSYLWIEMKTFKDYEVCNQTETLSSVERTQDSMNETNTKLSKIMKFLIQWTHKLRVFLLSCFNRLRLNGLNPCRGIEKFSF